MFGAGRVSGDGSGGAWGVGQASERAAQESWGERSKMRAAGGGGRKQRASASRIAPRMRPIAVAGPVATTIACARPLVMRVPANSRLTLSWYTALSVPTARVPFSTEDDSPVRIDWSARSEAPSRRATRRSAGTWSPTLTSTTSPGTSSAEGTDTAAPLLHIGGVGGLGWMGRGEGRSGGGGGRVAALAPFPVRAAAETLSSKRAHPPAGRLPGKREKEKSAHRSTVARAAS